MSKKQNKIINQKFFNLANKALIVNDNGSTYSEQTPQYQKLRIEGSNTGIYFRKRSLGNLEARHPKTPLKGTTANHLKMVPGKTSAAKQPSKPKNIAVKTMQSSVDLKKNNKKIIHPVLSNSPISNFQREQPRNLKHKTGVLALKTGVSDIALMEKLFVNNIMMSGKKSQALKIFYAAKQSLFKQNIGPYLRANAGKNVHAVGSTKTQPPIVKLPHHDRRQVRTSPLRRPHLDHRQVKSGQNLARGNVMAASNFPVRKVEPRRGGVVPLASSIFSLAVENVKPWLEVRKVKIGGSIRQVPSTIPEKRAQRLAVKWIIEAAWLQQAQSKSSSKTVGGFSRGASHVESASNAIKQPRVNAGQRSGALKGSISLPLRGGEAAPAVRQPRASAGLISLPLRGSTTLPRVNAGQPSSASLPWKGSISLPLRGSTFLTEKLQAATAKPKDAEAGFLGKLEAARRFGELRHTSNNNNFISGQNKNGFSQYLAQEILNASRKRGRARQKRDELHKLALSNRASVRFRWW